MDLAGVASTKALAELINQAGMSKGTLDRIARDGRVIKAHEAEWIGEATGLPASFFLADEPVPKDSSIEGELAGVLREIKAQLGRQTEVLEEIRGHAKGAERMLAEQRKLKDETEDMLPLMREILAGHPQADLADPTPEPQPTAPGAK